MNPDYTKVPVDLQAKIKKWESNTPAAKQLMILEDVAGILQEVLTTLDSGQKVTGQYGSLLLDIREGLQALNAREMPESPDFSKPVVEALSKLSAAVADIEVKPEVNVAAPQLQVDAPQVTVDLSRVEKVLKSDIPKAFKEAMVLIPKTEIPENDYRPVLDKFDEVLAQLNSLETATRMKPLPGSIKVTNLDAVTDELIQLNTQYAAYKFDPNDSAPTYIGKNTSANADDDQVDWVIYKFTYSGSDVTDIRKKTGSWASRASLF